MEKENVSDQDKRDLFDRMKAGEPIRLDDPHYFKVQEVVNRDGKALGGPQRIY